MDMKRTEQRRRLSVQEKRRAECFERNKAELEARGYTAQNHTISIVFANVVVLIAAIPFFVLCFMLFFWKNDMEMAEWGVNGCILFLIGLVVMVVVHELIHGLFFGLFAENHFHSISFGIIWKFLTPYCTCSETLKRRPYVIATLMPTLLVGLLPLAVGIGIGSFWLTLLGAAMTLSGGGDILIWIHVLRSHPTEQALLVDHPYECGFVLFDRQEKLK